MYVFGKKEVFFIDGSPQKNAQIAEQYLLDNVLAAEGIARSILREEIGKSDH